MAEDLQHSRVFVLACCPLIFLCQESIPITLSLFNRNGNRGCFVYIFSLRFSGSKFLMNLWQQFCARKTFFVYLNFFAYRFLRDLQSFVFKNTNLKKLFH